MSLGNNASQSVQLVSKLVTAAILFFGAQLVIDGALTVGELVAFNILPGRVSGPVLRTRADLAGLPSGAISIDRLGDILNTPAEPTYNPSRAAMPPIRGDVAFEHVTFRYRIDGPEVLHDVSFNVPAGQVIGIVGPSGSGKSTLAKLIQRLLCARGRPRLHRWHRSGNGRPSLATASGRFCAAREHIVQLLSAREHRAGRPRHADRARHRAAQLAGAHDFILELPEGYDTVVGERGSSLSGGQRQRMAIARALVTDPRILIFDEATSALDYESERIIQQNMKAISASRTVFVIAHRLSTVRGADRIIAIDRGRLVEDGTHDQLIARGGRYASLYRIQSGLHEVG